MRSARRLRSRAGHWVGLRASLGSAVLAVASLPLPIASAAPAAFHAAVAADNPLLHYKFDETSGTAVVNYGSLGATFNGAYNGTVTLGVATLSGDTGVTFDGSDDFIESLAAAPAGLTGNPSFTAEAIVRVPPAATAVLWPTFLHWGQGLTGKEVYFSLQNGRNDKVYAGFYNGGRRMTGTISLGDWHHIVMVRQGGGTDQIGTILFVDGVSVPLEADTDLCCNGTTPDVTSTALRINRGRDFTRFFTGSMDEVVLYDQVLSGTRVMEHHAAFAPSTTTTTTSSTTSTTTSTPTSTTAPTSTTSTTVTSTTTTTQAPTTVAPSTTTSTTLLGRSCSDIQALVGVRAQIEAECDCAGARNHGTYVRCAKRVARRLARDGLLPRDCREVANECAARSTCGKSGSVICCLETSAGTRCRIKRRAAKCVTRGGCVAGQASCCDACGANGCAPLGP